MAKRLITLHDAAEILGVRYSRAADLARQDLIPTVRLGRNIRIDPVKLDEFIDNGGQALPGGWRRAPAA
jgi:excisionase family DNA binding protein